MATTKKTTGPSAQDRMVRLRQQQNALAAQKAIRDARARAGAPARTASTGTKKTASMVNTPVSGSTGPTKLGTATKTGTAGGAVAKKVAKPIGRIAKGPATEITTPGFKGGTKVKKQLY